MPIHRSAPFPVSVCAFCACAVQADDSQTPQNINGPCTTGIAAYASELHTLCYVYAELAPPDAKPIRSLKQGDGLHAGEQIACAVGSEVTITYCASRADVEVRASAGFVNNGAKVKRYTIANVPQKNREEQPNVAPALRMAMDWTIDQQRYFFADPDTTRVAAGGWGSKKPERKPKAMPDPKQQLTRLVERVKIDGGSSFGALSIDSEWQTNGWAARDHKGRIAYCAFPDGLVVAPASIEGTHLTQLTDSDGLPFGQTLAALAQPDVITTLKSKWQFPGTAPVDVTTYVARVDKVICAVNVSTQIPEAKWNAP